MIWLIAVASGNWFYPGLVLWDALLGHLPVRGLRHYRFGSDNLGCSRTNAWRFYTFPRRRLPAFLGKASTCVHAAQAKTTSCITLKRFWVSCQTSLILNYVMYIYIYDCCTMQYNFNEKGSDIKRLQTVVFSIPQVPLTSLKQFFRWLASSEWVIEWLIEWVIGWVSVTEWVCVCVCVCMKKVGSGTKYFLTPFQSQHFFYALIEMVRKINSRKDL